MSIAAKRAEAAPELAAKEAQYRIIQEEIKLNKKIRLIEKQHKRELEMQQSHSLTTECLQAERYMVAAPARLRSMIEKSNRRVCISAYNLTTDFPHTQKILNVLAQIDWHPLLISLIWPKQLKRA